MNLNEIIEETKSLNPEQKLELARKILESIDIESDEIEKAHIEEAERRLEAYEKGYLETVSYEEVFNR